MGNQLTARIRCNMYGRRQRGAGGLWAPWIFIHTAVLMKEREA